MWLYRWLSAQSEAPPPASNLTSDHTVALLLSVCESSFPHQLLILSSSLLPADSNNNEVSSKLLNIIIDAVAPSTAGLNPDLCVLPLQSLSTIAMHAKIRYVV